MTTAQDPATASMRPVVAAVLTQAAAERPDLVVLGADGHAFAMGFRQQYRQRYIDVGVAEANLVGVASGLARGGRPVVVGAMAPFLVRRANEQIRNDVCNPALDVTFIGVGGGFGYGTLGPTHHVVEDLGFFASLPHTRVFCPADVRGAAWAVREALAWPGPAYVRLGARDDEIIFTGAEQFALDRMHLLRQGDEALVIAAGAAVPIALRAADALAGRGIRLSLAVVTVVKPFPVAHVRELAGSIGVVATAEDHFGPSGVAGQVALALAGSWSGTFLPHAADDRYPPVGDRDELLGYYGVSTEAIAENIIAALTT